MIGPSKFRLILVSLAFALTLLLSLTFAPRLPASAPATESSCTSEVVIDGAISTATFDFVERATKRSIRDSCASILFTINTPGGSLQTTRMIVEKILASPIPVLCLVSPEGGHAGSAGALIMLACHVSGMLPATNVGAATPIAGNGASLGDDLRKKVVEDTKSWAMSLAKKRGRSTTFAEKIITESKSYDADEALKLGGVDIVAKSIPDFLKQARGREVLVATSIEGDGGNRIKVETGPVVAIEKDWREGLLSILTDPEFSYLLFMAALGLLYFEITHAGAIAPGVAGALMLMTSLVSFQKLDVSWGGVGLIVLGIVFLIAEAFVPSFGALGIGGIIALGVGSVFLYDPANGGLSLSLWLSLGVPLTLGISLLALALWIFRSRRTVRGNESVSERGVVDQVVLVEAVDANPLFGTVTVRGEIWSIESDQTLVVGDRVRVIAINGLKLKVQQQK